MIFLIIICFTLGVALFFITIICIFGVSQSMSPKHLFLYIILTCLSAAACYGCFKATEHLAIKHHELQTSFLIPPAPQPLDDKWLFLS
jgi:uncharacterized membrane protein